MIIAIIKKQYLIYFSSDNIPITNNVDATAVEKIFMFK